MTTKNSKTTQPTEMEKKQFKKFAKKRIGGMRFSLGAKTTNALVYLITEKFTTGEKIDVLAPRCQEYMQRRFPGYMPVSGSRFLNELEIDLEEKADIEKQIPKTIFEGGHPIDNFYKVIVKEIFPNMEVWKNGA